MDGLNYFWEVEVKNGHVTLVSEEQDNLADFFACPYIFRIAKSYFNCY